jgi:hypothetical protein
MIIMKMISPFETESVILFHDANIAGRIKLASQKSA